MYAPSDHFNRSCTRRRKVHAARLFLRKHLAAPLLIGAACFFTAVLAASADAGSLEESLPDPDKIRGMEYSREPSEVSHDNFTGTEKAMASKYSLGNGDKLTACVVDFESSRYLRNFLENREVPVDKDDIYFARSTEDDTRAMWFYFSGGTDLPREKVQKFAEKFGYRLVTSEAGNGSSKWNETGTSSDSPSESSAYVILTSYSPSSPFAQPIQELKNYRDADIMRFSNRENFPKNLEKLKKADPETVAVVMFPEEFNIHYANKMYETALKANPENKNRDYINHKVGFSYGFMPFRKPEHMSNYIDTVKEFESGSKKMSKIFRKRSFSLLRAYVYGRGYYLVRRFDQRVI